MCARTCTCMCEYAQISVLTHVETCSRCIQNKHSCTEYMATCTQEVTRMRMPLLLYALNARCGSAYQVSTHLCVVPLPPPPCHVEEGEVTHCSFQLDIVWLNIIGMMDTCIHEMIWICVCTRCEQGWLKDAITQASFSNEIIDHAVSVPPSSCFDDSPRMGERWRICIGEKVNFVFGLQG